MEIKRNMEVVEHKLVISTINVYHPCEYVDLIKDCDYSISHFDYDYERPTNVRFCTGVPDMEVCPGRFKEAKMLKKKRKK